MPVYKTINTTSHILPAMLKETPKEKQTPAGSSANGQKTAGIETKAKFPGILENREKISTAELVWGVLCTRNSGLIDLIHDGTFTRQEISEALRSDEFAALYKESPCRSLIHHLADIPLFEKDGTELVSAMGVFFRKVLDGKK